MTLTTAIKESFVYMSRPERGTQDPTQTLMTGRGSCRDFAVGMIEAVPRAGTGRTLRFWLSSHPDRGEWTTSRAAGIRTLGAKFICLARDG